MKKIIILSLASFLFLTSAFASSGVSINQPHIKDPVIIIKEPDIVKPPVKGLIVLNDNYATDENAVYVVDAARGNWIKIPDADRATFRVIGGQFARDGDQIFQMGKNIANADIANFTLFAGQNLYAQDTKYVYGPEGIMKDADVATFRVLPRNYAIDAGRVYFAGREMQDANSGDFEVLDSGLYARDDKAVFYAGQNLADVLPDGLVVKGSRAVTADGRTFVDGKITNEVVEPSTNALRNFLAPYMGHFTGHNIPFWIVVAMGFWAMFSFIFVFFAARNEEEVGFWKTLIKSLVALFVGIIAFWIASFFVSPFASQIFGIVIGLFMFIAFWSALGWIKSILITLLACIVFIFVLSIGGIVSRAVFGDFSHLMSFIEKPEIRLMGLMKIAGIFVGTWLIITQLGSSLFRAVGQSIVATVISLILLAFLFWLGSIGTLTSIIVFSVLYAVLLWIMRFRMVSNLFAETVRIVRIGLILALILGVMVWIVL